MRKRGKLDSNHPEIVSKLRDAGAAVLSLANLGGGAPDILVCYRWGGEWLLMLMEIKDGSRKPSERLLTPEELTFHQKWPGRIEIVESAEEALKLII